MRALKAYCKAILVMIIFLSLPLYSIDSLNTDTENNVYIDSLAHSSDIDSIEFTEVIKNVYVDKSEQSLIIDSGSFKSCAYKDTSAILQLMEVTEDFRWAILISMPAEIEGRAATTYLLIDIKNRKNMNSWLETETGRYLGGNYMEFEISTDGKTYLNCRDYKVELK
ncbi:MAG: hypothetical protein PF638_14040 [Candidatus Delongbacteria bacterium]|jgi:hypothetical protein|nr:hypothetical protein [Candidatus Delongbacteria bacterium]